MPFLSDQKNWRAPRPPPTLIIFPKSTDQNSEIAILFNVVKKPYNYVFGDDLLPLQSPWEGLQVRNFDQCLHIAMVIGKCTGVFRRIFWLGKGLRRGGYAGGTFYRGICHGGKKISMKGAQDLLALLKKKTMKKLNMKKFFQL